MKIIAGQYKNRNFYMPAGIRPTQSVLRAAVFDILGHDLEGLSMLELYAGSGAMSMEAISRGIASVVMVEHDPKNTKVIRENCELLGIELGGAFKILQGDAMATIKRLSDHTQRFDIVFFDPPYGLKLAKKTLKLLGSNDILAPRSFVVAQYDRTDLLEIPENFTIVTERRYGSSHLTIMQKVSE
ncbi:MAG: 16S rRNA (guanine(966)-N(2))-methyltransferase RsmD [Candidatus Omnitrophica bacterium]|nr:16S rRNA (guanine(966)-N(2))-methyltransferase RsmD [Candidatus Omnitrophota bacterium]